MDKDKPQHVGASSLHPPRRCLASPPPNISCNVTSEQLASSALSPPGGGISSEQGHVAHAMPSDSNQFSLDISRMPDNPPKNLGHRRACSEILTLLDDINFDNDLGVVGELDEIEEEDSLSLYLDMDKFNSSCESSAFQVGELSTSTAAAPGSVYVDPASSEKPRIRHQHSQSMDGSSTIEPEMLMPGSEDPSPVQPMKDMSAANLAELAIIDPKRAKRIWANRQSAARSKERKLRYIAELERKVQTLQTETMPLAGQLNLLQRDTNSLASENRELKLQLQTVEQQVHLQDALNDALREEIQHLKVLTGQAIPNGGPPINIPTSFGAKQQHYSNNHAPHSSIINQQLQHLHLQQHFQQQQLQHR